MGKVLVLGGGISGCCAAYKLFEAGEKVVIVEKTHQLGGNIKNFGCKADDECVKDNLCLVEDIFYKVSNENDIEILYNSEVIDLSRKSNGYCVEIKNSDEHKTLTGFEAIILATGYVKFSDKETGTIQWNKDKNIIWASTLEELLYKRKSNINLPENIKKVVFIQCNGSRSILEKADYCSRVCCGYTYRMARALRKFYSNIDITILYMDLQEAGYMQELSFEVLDKLNIKYFLCKPVNLEKKDSFIEITYENREKGRIEKITTDLTVLSEGMHPGSDNEKLAEIFNLQIDEKGFLNSIEDEAVSRIYPVGTVKGPKDIAESINDATNAVNMILYGGMPVHPNADQSIETYIPSSKGDVAGV